MRKFKKLLLIFSVLVLCLSISNCASAAVKLSSKKITITAGKTKTLKVKGTKKKVKWKSSNKKIATVTSKGKVKGIKAGSCKITATVGGKKYTCSVKVVAKKVKGEIKYKSAETMDGVVVVAKNNYTYAVSVDMDCLFYDEFGDMIKKSSDSEYALEAGRECALFFYNYEKNWDSYKINIKAKKASSNIIFNAKNIEFFSNYGDENVMVMVSNEGNRNSFTEIAIVFYVNGSVLGYDSSFADVENKGDVDYLEFSFPYDFTYGTIVPDDYEIYVNSSYRYNWQ